MRTRLAAFSFTAAILASVLVPAFGGTASADGGDGCVGQHVQAEIDHHGSLLEGLVFHLNPPTFEHTPDDEHKTHPVFFKLDEGSSIAGYLDALRFHCGR